MYKNEKIMTPFINNDKTLAWFLSEVQKQRDKCRIKAWTNESETKVIVQIETAIEQIADAE